MAVPRIFQLPKQSPLQLGATVPGALAQFFEAGTTTPQSVYTTAEMDVAHANPVVADAAGEFAPIYLDDDLAYRVQIKTALGALIYDQDYINDPNVRAPYYRHTATESSVGLTVVDFVKWPGYINRYGTNTTPGTTDLSSAIRSAISAQAGEVVFPFNEVVACDGDLNFSTGRTIVRGGATLKYLASSTEDQVATISGNNVVVDNLKVDGNRSGLPGTNGDGHTGHGYGFVVTGNHVRMVNCDASNMPITDTETNSIAFEINGEDCVLEGCGGDTPGYAVFRANGVSTDSGGQPRGNITLRDCYATNARRGFINNNSAENITIDNFHFEPAANADVAILCEISAKQFNLVNTHIRGDCGQNVVKVVSPQFAHFKNCVLHNTRSADEATHALYIQLDSNAVWHPPELITIDSCFLSAGTSATGTSSRAPLRIDGGEIVVISNTELNCQSNGEYCLYVDSDVTSTIILDNVTFSGSPQEALIRVSGTSSTNFPRLIIKNPRVDCSTSVPFIQSSGSTPAGGLIDISGVHDESGNLTGIYSTQPSLPAFAAADATPSVLGSKVWLTDTGTLTITDFDGKEAGKTIRVISKGAVTFDTTGTNLIGSSADIVTASGDVTEWLCEGSVWRLVNFNDASADNS